MQLFSSEESEVTAYIIKSQQPSRFLFFFLKDAKFIEIKLRAKARSLCSERLEHCPSTGDWIHIHTKGYHSETQREGLA